MWQIVALSCVRACGCLTVFILHYITQVAESLELPSLLPWLLHIFFYYLVSGALFCKVTYLTVTLFSSLLILSFYVAKPVLELSHSVHWLSQRNTQVFLIWFFNLSTPAGR